MSIILKERELYSDAALFQIQFQFGSEESKELVKRAYCYQVKILECCNGGMWQILHQANEQSERKHTQSFVEKA